MWRKRKRRKIGERKVDRETECDPSAVNERLRSFTLTSHCNFVNLLRLQSGSEHQNPRRETRRTRRKPDEKGMERNRK